MLKKAIIIFFVAAAIRQVRVAPTIDSELAASLGEKPVNVLVRMKDRTAPTLSAIRSLDYSTRSERIAAVVKALRDFTNESQKPVVDFLSQEQTTKSFRFEPLWVTNMIMIRDADLDTVMKLSEFPEIESINAELEFPLDPILDFHEYTPEELGAIDEGEVQWGVATIQAPEVWQSGNRGQKVVVATVDTGARGTHEALAGNFRGEYGWFDPGQGTLTPNDGNGHGTHTTATIAGTVRNVGVAPGALWAACKGCAGSFCLQFDLLKCGQFFACPTLADGTAENCDQVPDVVSNSWGGGRGNEWYKETVEAYKKMGAIPLFSQGNSGPNCGTANSPGDYDNLIGVGSTTSDELLSYFSSVGPTTIGGRVKPDVAAPGSNVFSAYHTSDTAYASMSGTSMACPHAAGTVALILSENSNLNYDQVKGILQSGSVGTIGSTGQNCGAIPEDVYPNNHVGSGRIDASRSVNTVRMMFRKD